METSKCPCKNECRNRTGFCLKQVERNKEKILNTMDYALCSNQDMKKINGENRKN